MARQRGEVTLLELEDKALEAVDRAWKEYNAEGQMLVIPSKLVNLIAEVHKMVMQRLNAKYGVDGSVPDLKRVHAALVAEAELIEKMIEQQEQVIQ